MNNKVIIIVTLMLGTSMAAIDSSIVSVSLPVMRQQFHARVDEIEWVITAYMISFSLCIPLISWFKNRVGYYQLYLWSIIIFTVGSLLCSLSTSLNMLIVARVLQAVGGGSIAPTSLAIVSETFPPNERGSAIGWWGLGNVMGPALGPTLGGLLTHYFGWQSIFYVNIPIGLLTIFLIVKNLSYLNKWPALKPRFDTKGYIYFAVFIIAIQYAVASIAKYGVLSKEVIMGTVVSVLSLALFIRSAKRKSPLLDLTVFKSPVFVSSIIVVAIRSVALFGGMFFLPFLLQGLLGYSEIEAGLLLLPNALIMLFIRPMAGKYADKGAIRNISMAGIVIVALSMFMLAGMNVGVAVWFIILTMLVRGIGMSLLIAPVSTAMLNAVKSSQAATATTFNSLALQLGGSVGIAVSGVIHQYIYSHYLQKGSSEMTAEHFALQDGFLISGILIILALVPAWKLPVKPKMSS